jgi:hypothetical protein
LPESRVTPGGWGATAHKLARIVDHLVRFGGDYVKKTEAEYDEQVRVRLEKQLRRRAAVHGDEDRRGGVE